MKVVRRQDQILLFLYDAHPVALERDEAIELAQILLDLCGKMKQEKDEEMLDVG